MMRANFDTIKNELMQKRQQELVQFTKEANDFPPVEVISHENIVGTIPSNFITKINYTSHLRAPVLNNDIAESQLHIVRVAPDPKIKDDMNVASTTNTNFYNRPSDKYPPTQYTAGFLKPEVQPVKVHVFRGPNIKYTTYNKHKKQEKYYSHWGYFVFQPADNDHSKNGANNYFS
ncbi:uncharacterized protein LOC106665220 isoform X2 [Cimex lectularius]|nr:uncharacterized protein LOC106665220 isoform X2 [Cimex lectularius]XP_024082525.1 uncharacterized protein LOC106665220 isoform X2 [Cimex lectularius]